MQLMQCAQYFHHIINHRERNKQQKNATESDQNAPDIKIVSTLNSSVT